MNKRFNTQYPIAPPMNDISNLYKRIRIEEQLQLFDEVIKKVKIKKLIIQTPKNKEPFLVQAKSIQLKTERTLSVRSPRIPKILKKQVLPKLVRQKPSISGWEVNIHNDSQMYY
ncbi:unnamed protein product (macronuclear) [Paramecium tetraurelia]|uniref:Uncharacterized protein n=1 Tax=Paramecium tetraurelia TaxID=5888 RepID=A0DEU2_PARTE|nr:uncharacterized protein GSPATT00016385001 [Paramecium tetraurelia]CAK81559.1 unnamed protein product [Paramecium tetraurelia]|eukprot:XP_001448956.1 hypothetical protein (macronuclear) [Paramecium tetraurelia strain d4-2]